jgi:hypothetical protein
MIFSRLVLFPFCCEKRTLHEVCLQLPMLYFKKMEQFQFADHSNKNYINVKQKEASYCLHVGLFF